MFAPATCCGVKVVFSSAVSKIFSSSSSSTLAQEQTEPYGANNYPISNRRTIPSLFLVLCLRRYLVIGVIIFSVSPPRNLAFH